MKINRVIHHSPAELVERLRRVTMLADPQCLIYREAFISLEKIHPN